MKEATLVKNLPNASKLVYSLRHLDYTNITALADIVDNSIDATASQIWVNILPEKEEKSSVGSIIISDNGTGMTKEILDEALKLGSDVAKNPACDLGLYGMGLVTASISIGTKLEVITKTPSGQCLRSIQDLDLIYEKNEFIKVFEEADEDTTKTFNYYVIEMQKKYPIVERDKQGLQLKNSGTVVIISNIDNCHWRTIKGLADNLIAHFSKTYRKFLTAGNNHIYVQGQEVKPTDPIFDFEPNILNEEEIKLEEGTIKIVIAEVKDYGATINKDKGINIPNQGFYVIRNNREILFGETFGLFTKHNDFNTLRIEFSYPGTLDRVLSSNFSKNKIILSQSLTDRVAKVCNPFIKQVRNNAKQRQKPTDEAKEDFSDVEKYITQKSHLLKRPPVEIEERGPKTSKNGKHKEPISEHSPRLDILKRKRVTLESLKANFRLKSLTEKGPVYEADQEKDIVIIYWNQDHPFYKYFIERNSDQPDILNPICFLIYSFGTAELISKPDSDSQEIIENIRYDVGRNLAVLLKD